MRRLFGENHRLDPFIVFIICLLPRLYVSLRTYPVFIPSDEVSAMSAAALTAGLNWKDVVSNAGYYGFGFLWIFAPLFLIIDSPIWIYRIIMLGLSIVEAMTSVVCYMTLSLIFPNVSRSIKNLISIICGLINILSTVNIANRNEEILALVVWTIILLLAKIIMSTDPKKKTKAEVFLLMVLLYSLTLHTRATMLFIALIVVSAIHAIVWKRLPFHIWIYILLAAGYIVVSLFVKMYQDSIWTETARNASLSDNASGFMSLIRQDGINFKMISIFFLIILGQFYTACIMTGGLYIFVIISFFSWIVGIRKKELTNQEKTIFLIGSFALFCVLGTSFSQGLTWLPGLYNGNEYRLKAFTYMRYFGIYVSPVVMCGIIIHKGISEKAKKKNIAASFIILIALTVFWGCCNYPLLKGTQWYSGTDWQYMFLGQMKNTVQSTERNWMLAIVMLLEIVCVLIFFFNRKRVKICMLLFVSFLIMERCYTFDHKMLPDAQGTYGTAKAGYMLIKQLEGKRPLDDGIYVFDARDRTDHQIYYEYQFLNFKHHIIPELPNSMDSTLVFSNKNISDLLPTCWYVQLSNKEYVFFDSYEDMNIISNLGYEPVLSISSNKTEGNITE